MSPSSIITIKSEEDDVKCTTASSSKPNARLQRLREVLLQRSSPICRFRAEIFWKIGDTFLKNSHPNVFIISVRAIGPRCQIEQDSSRALVSALQSREITPRLLQRQDMDSEWKNHWIVHINPQDATRLPSYTDKDKGIFWNSSDDLFLFIWSVVPMCPQEEKILEGRFLRFEAHIPAVHPYNSPMADDLWNDIRLEPPEVESAPLSVTSAKYTGEKFGNTMIKNGNFTLLVDQIPDTPSFRCFLRSPRIKKLIAWWNGMDFKIDLVPSCETCGAEGHIEDNCVYDLTIKALINQLNVTRAHTIPDMIVVPCNSNAFTLTNQKNQKHPRAGPSRKKSSHTKPFILSKVKNSKKTPRS